MKVVSAFSRFAHEYNKYNVIQKDVAKKLCKYLDKKSYENILDVGAGDGAIYNNINYRNIQFSNFVALDFSKEMLDVHPNDMRVKKLCFDFNSHDFSASFRKNEFDLIISSSALQWSDDLKHVLKELSNLADSFAFAFFTANTFKTLHTLMNLTSPILTKKEILEALDTVFTYEVEVLHYKLDFESVHEMLRYIKRSGVSGGVKQLSYKEIKFLMLEYPLAYLEFEILLVNVAGKK